MSIGEIGPSDSTSQSDSEETFEQWFQPKIDLTGRLKIVQAVLPNRPESLPISFLRSKIELWNVHSHGGPFLRYAEKIADMVQIGEGEPQPASDDLVQVNMTLSGQRSRIQPVTQKPRGKIGKVKTSTIPSNNYFVRAQSRHEPGENRLLLCCPPNSNILAGPAFRHQAGPNHDSSISLQRGRFNV